jgi:hypothetical protein
MPARKRHLHYKRCPFSSRCLPGRGASIISGALFLGGAYQKGTYSLEGTFLSKGTYTEKVPTE